jgi:hypothetical protein
MTFSRLVLDLGGLCFGLVAAVDLWWALFYE